MIGIVDADLIGRKRHRFPNLALEKIAGFFKEREEVRLITDYDEIRSNRRAYNRIYMGKVFTDTPVPEDIFCYDIIGGGYWILLR